MKKRISCVILCFFACFAAFGCNNISYWHMQTSVFTSINFEVDMIGQQKSQAYDQMLDMMDQLNRQINVNTADIDPLVEGDNPSDILRLNLADANKPVQIGHHAYYLLQAAKQMYALTDGAFNVASYPLAYLWGVDAISNNYYNINFDYKDSPTPPSFVNSTIRPQFKPTKEQIEQVKEFCNLDDIEIWTADGNYYAQKSRAEVAVDLGGIAKGYAADLCAQIAAEHQIESAFINISGNLLMFGQLYEGKWKDSWTIALREPKQYSSNILCKFLASPNSTAVTSGDYERTRILINGDVEEAMSLPDEEFMALVQQVPHIIDTKRGVPYTLEIVDEEGVWSFYNTAGHVDSATIVGPNSMYADCIATAACVMGLNKSVAFLTQIMQEYSTSGLIFTSDMQYAATGNITLTDTKNYDGFKSYTKLVQIGQS